MNKPRISSLILSVLGIVAMATRLSAAPENDHCESAVHITGVGDFPFDGSGATAGEANSCLDETAKDIWFCWTAPDDGTFTIETCGRTLVDTELAIFEGCQCPAAKEMACDVNSLLPCNPQSAVTLFPFKAGEQYLIQLATLPPLSGGPGSIGITAGEPPRGACQQWSTFIPTERRCNAASSWDALESTRERRTVSTSFSVEFDTDIGTELARNAAAPSAFCWSGAYFNGTEECARTAPDEFVLTLYADDCGVPGEIYAGPFSQADGTLIVEGPERKSRRLGEQLTVFEYGGLHDTVSLQAGTTYWLEITNSADGDCNWYWEAGPSSDTVSYQDGRSNGILDGYDEFDHAAYAPHFCVAAYQTYESICHLPPLNDNCDDAWEVAENETWVNTFGASTDGSPVRLHSQPATSDCNLPLADWQINQDVWFDYAADCTGPVELSLCGSTFDSKLAVYDDLSCPPEFGPVACSDDACGPELALDPAVNFSGIRGRTYRVRVGGYRQATGTGVLVASHDSPPATTLLHFASLAECFTGDCKAPPCAQTTSCCASFDLDHNGDVGLHDHAKFVDIMSGP